MALHCRSTASPRQPGGAAAGPSSDAGEAREAAGYAAVAAAYPKVAAGAGQRLAADTDKPDDWGGASTFPNISAYPCLSLGAELKPQCKLQGWGRVWVEGPACASLTKARNAETPTHHLPTRLEPGQTPIARPKADLVPYHAYTFFQPSQSITSPLLCSVGAMVNFCEKPPHSHPLADACRRCAGPPNIVLLGRFRD